MSTLMEKLYWWFDTKTKWIKALSKNKTVMKIVILGGGESGVGAALLAKVKGYEVLSDKSALSDKLQRNF